MTDLVLKPKKNQNKLIFKNLVCITYLLWDKNGVNKTMRARKNCSINNNSHQKPAVHLYNNPTLFSYSFVNPDNYI